MYHNRCHAYERDGWLVVFGKDMKLGFYTFPNGNRTLGRRVASITQPLTHASSLMRETFSKSKLHHQQVELFENQGKFLKQCTYFQNLGISHFQLLLYDSLIFSSGV